MINQSIEKVLGTIGWYFTVITIYSYSEQPSYNSVKCILTVSQHIHIKNQVICIQGRIAKRKIGHGFTSKLNSQVDEGHPAPE
jgi:hypothetical protein